MESSKIIKIISGALLAIGWIIWLMSGTVAISAPQQSVVNERFMIWILAAIWLLLIAKKE